MLGRLSVSIPEGEVCGFLREADDAADDAVVLLHGANGHAAEWKDFVQHLAWDGEVIAVDLPHHGETRWRGDFGVNECLRAVKAVLEHRGIARAHVIGSSFGGVVALRLAEQLPETVVSVSTLGTGPGGAGELAEALASSIEAHGARSVYAEVIPAFSYPPNTPQHVLDQAIERASGVADSVAAQILRTAFGAVAVSPGAQLDLPMSIIGGAEDRTSTASSVETLAEQLGTMPWLLPGLGHLPHIESASRLAAILQPVLRVPVRPERMLRDLRELDARTRDSEGVQRLCWTPMWAETRRWFLARLAEIPNVEVEIDAAGNCHATLPGLSAQTIVIGSHLDSVPNGGNLDGGYGVISGLEVLRAAASRQAPLPFTLRLTDWVDEEGARFGKSLFGSSAVAGTLDLDTFRVLRDVEGRTSEEVLGECGVNLDALEPARTRLTEVIRYLELHIEQGPRLEAAGATLAAVTGSLGVMRYSFTLHGTPSHAGGTPMQVRKDPVQAAAACLAAGRRIAEDADALFTCGVLSCAPATPTAIPETVTFSVDVRHGEAAKLQQVWQAILSAFGTACEAEGVRLEMHSLWEIEPVHFDPELIEHASEVIERMTARETRLPSGPLHDACEMSGAGIPTVMLFVPSVDGISHAAAEHMPDEALCDGVRALGALLHEVWWKRPAT